ncbi:hypothetical protein ACWGDS_25910 [Streptomyces sp. NPDC055059]
MSTHNDEVRVIEYWPNEDERIIVVVKRSPEVDAMTDDELIKRSRDWRRGNRHLRAVDDPE